MKRSIFGLFQYGEFVGAVVLGCVVVFIAALVNAGLVKDWFQPSSTLRVLLPEEGVAGLSAGAEVHVLGTRAGEVRRIVIDPSQRLHAIVRVENQMRPFIRRDSQVFIRRQFGVAGAAFLDITRGSGPELDWSYAVVTAGNERAPTDTIGQLVDEVRGRVVPIMDDLQKAIVAFTVVAQRAVDPAGPLERTLGSAANVASRIEKGEGTAGRLLADDKIVVDLEATMANLRELSNQLERSSQDPRIAEIVNKTNAILSSLQTTTRGLSETAPKITRNVVSATDTMPATLLQAQITAHELELLLAQLRHHWLFGGSGNAPPAGTRLPAAQVRP
jgi:phospholipid/cholesterol/gamma-HCH transport system substrate-binding protein